MKNIRNFYFHKIKNIKSDDAQQQTIFKMIECGLFPSWTNRIPFLVPLRDCKSGKLPTPEDFPIAIANELGRPPQKWVKKILDEGRGLILLDGVDEVPNLHRETVKSQIGAYLSQYPDNFFLVSTRPAAVGEEWLADMGFRESRINPMSDVDRERFIDKWHEAVSRELARQGRSQDLSDLAARLKEQLPEIPSIARLGTNPLLCAMICALHRDRAQKLPETQSELCEALCHMLLHRRERESGLNLDEFPTAYRSLNYEQKRAIVQNIAASMVRNEDSTVSRNKCDRIVRKTLKNLSGTGPADASIVCDGLIERSGMLRESRPGVVEFIHNTFKEFLAADCFVADGDVGLLARNALDPSWQPILRFAAATRDPDFASNLIRRIIRQVQCDEERVKE